MPAAVCGATAYRPVIARDANGAMMPSGAYRCVRCKLEFTSIDQWRSAAGSAYSAVVLDSGAIRSLSGLHHMQQSRPSGKYMM